MDVLKELNFAKERQRLIRIIKASWDMRMQGAIAQQKLGNLEFQYMKNKRLELIKSGASFTEVIDALHYFHIVTRPEWEVFLRPCYGIEGSYLLFAKDSMERQGFGFCLDSIRFSELYEKDWEIYAFVEKQE